MTPGSVAATGRHERHQELLEQLRALARQAAESAGVELVDLHVAGSSTQRRVRVDIDRGGPASVTHDDCQAVSSTLGATIEASGLIASAYVLEVSSPGVDRPIRSSDDARRNVGRRIRIQTNVAIGGRREFVGLLRALVGDDISLEDEMVGSVQIPLGSISVARQEVAF
jgi:ribosome maturation factor RimP